MWLLTLPVVSECSLRHFYRSSLEIFVVIKFNEESVGSTILLYEIYKNLNKLPYPCIPSQLKANLLGSGTFVDLILFSMMTI